MEGGSPPAAPQPVPTAVPPPLPLEPHPSEVHAQQKLHMGYSQVAAPQHYSANHFAQPVMHWQQEGFSVNHNPDIPPISSLLLREADAWRAVLSLHSSVLSSAQQISRSPENVWDATVNFDDKEENSQSREASYCSALSGLAGQCDSLFNEVLKLRTLRKARRSVEVDCATNILRSHSDEVLAFGQTLASNGSLNVSSATTDVRLAIQAQRNQVSQLRVFLDCIKTASALPLPKGCKLVVGVKFSGSEYVDVRELDELFRNIYENSRDVDETSLSNALSNMFLSSGDSLPSQAGGSLQFARRSGTREVSMR